MADKNTLKSWFETNDIPTQEQFWELIDSFFHKNEQIPITSITDIETILSEKADTDAFNSHLTDPDAHPQLLTRAKFVQIGQFTVWKHPDNNDPTKKFILETNDMVMGFVGITWILGKYLGGDITMLENFEDFNHLEL